MIYIKDGKMFETPIFAERDGMNVELNDEQLRSLGYMTQADAEYVQTADVENRLNVRVDKLSLLLATISVQTPDGAVMDGDVIRNLPFKLGQKWVPVLNGNVVTYQLVDDPDAFGLADKPFFFFDGNVNRLFPNAYYMHDNKRYVYVGTTPSEAADWSQCSDDMEEF